jgi:hypothetical protein
MRRPLWTAENRSEHLNNKPLSNGRHAIDLDFALRWITLCIWLVADPLDQGWNGVANKVSQ